MHSQKPFTDLLDEITEVRRNVAMSNDTLLEPRVAGPGAHRPADAFDAGRNNTDRKAVARARPVPRARAAVRGREERIIRKLGLVLCAVLAGCSTTEVLPVGPDTYRVSGTAINSFGGYTTAETEALTKANEYCQSQGRQLLMLNHQDSAPTLGSGAAGVTFRCLAPGDPELRRPNYRPGPNVVIENRTN
jgi:hypothetical protein